MNKKGMTLIESVVTIAILGIIFFLAAPLIRNFGGVTNRTVTQKDIDSKFLVTNEFIQKKIKAAKSSSSNKYARVYLYEKDVSGETIPYFDSATFNFSTDEVTDGTEGNILFLEIPEDDGSISDNFFYFNENEIGYQKDSGSEILIENVEDANFRFDKGIILYYINLDIEDAEGKFNDTLRGSASTRIDINY